MCFRGFSIRIFSKSPEDVSNFGLECNPPYWLFTNNPETVSSFKDTEFEVVSRQPVEIDPGEENASYLKTKQDNMGHMFSRIKL